MATCLSRRACSDKVAFRLLKDGKQKFTIFTEYRCPNVVAGSKVCEECSKKLPMYKYQANQKCDHGLVGGPYTKDSKLYGSPYYLNCIKKGYTISEIDETRAKEAIITSTSNMPKKCDNKKGEDKTVDAMEVKPVEEVKPKKKSYKLKSSVPVIDTPIIEPSNTQIKPTMLESIQSAITVSDVIVVKVKKIRHQGSDYYFDGSSGKLYKATSNGVGKYAGRYNSETDVLNTSYPDSDNE